VRVLVTGATGYIGSHVCKLLSEHGYEVWGFDKNIHGEYNNVEKYCHKFWIQDIMDQYLHSRADAVVHLAGRSVVPDSLKEPSEYYRVNVMGTKNAVEKLHHDHFLFASTSAAWDMGSPYARSKVAAEDVIKEKANGYTIFRFFNVSGTDGIHRQLGAPTHLIRVAAMVAAGKIPDLKIFGTDYATRDGTCIRDYIHVVDLANAIVTAVERGPANTDYECLGSNVGYSVREVISTMQEVTGKKLNIRYAPRRAGDAVASVVDNLSNLVTLNKSIEDMCLDQYELEVGKNG